MIKKPITINLSTGLEARPVAQLVQVASQFNSEIYVEIGKKRVNAKSIMGMMTLGREDRFSDVFCRVYDSNVTVNKVNSNTAINFIAITITLD